MHVFLHTSNCYTRQYPFDTAVSIGGVARGGICLNDNRMFIEGFEAKINCLIDLQIIFSSEAV